MCILCFRRAQVRSHQSPRPKSFLIKFAEPQDTKPKKVDAPKPSAAVSKSDAAPQPGPEDVPKKAPGRPRKSKNATTTEPANKPLVSEGSEHGSAELLEVDPNNSRRKRRKTDSPVHEDSVEEVRGLEFPKNAKQDKASEQNGASPSSRKAARLNQSHLTLQNPGLYNGDFTREKPSRSAEATMPSENAKRESNISEANETGRISSAELLNGFQTDGDNASVVVGNAMPAVEPPATIIADSKPKKILRLNSKTGTIGSPPTKKALPLESTAKRPSRSRSPKSRIVTIRYGDDELLPIGIGQKIEQILNGTLRAPVPGKPIPEPPPKAAAKHVPTQPAKTPHPFFLGKAALKQSLNNADTPKNTTDPEVVDITKFEDPKRIQTRPSVKPYSPAKPKSTPFTGFGKSSMVLKFPGAVEPAWPWQGMIHIRGIDRGSSKNTSNGSETLEIRSHAKKSKYRAVQIPSSEEVIGTLAKELAIDNVVKDIRETNPDEFPPLPKCLRLPTKHYEGGSALQRRIRLQIRTKMPLPKTAQASSSDDDIRTNTPIRAPPHPALSRVYNMIPTTMSAFDRGQCETLSWTQKYSPKSSADVLQKGREALILKEWLQKLTVQSVDTGSNDKPPRRASSEVPVKRKRKSKKLDGFIISSDEEDNDMDEITDPEDSISLDDGSGLLKKTTIRVGDTAKESGRVTNAVVISGPHGSGKTAAVYAVAKELGFEVFEINSSSRRSGKDILEKVGDMTRNHQVQCSQGPVVVDEDEKRIDDALAHDLQSGRQGTMNSFFQPKGALKPKTKPSKPKSSKKEVKDKPVAKSLLKQQKQSLILVEEADILFEEDKNFWSTIVELTIISKRPIIITCTNESVLQMDALILHAIVRFAPPPIDLAVDYMLLVAACEGHVLQRDAIKSLYECRSLDLRASLTDLNFWCQFAVGDVKSGLSWFYPRWSPGEDVDDHGETIRVVSENTYETGMGCLSQDVLKSEVDLLDIEEEVLHEACDGWQLDVGGWQENAGINSWANKAHTLGGKEHDTRALKRYENFSSSMSDADLISGSTFAPENQVSNAFSPSHTALTTVDPHRCQHARTIIQSQRRLHPRSSTHRSLFSRRLHYDKQRHIPLDEIQKQEMPPRPACATA